MKETTFKIKVDSSEIAPLIALCKEQAELISDLHERVHSATLDKRVANMLEAISDMKLDVPLNKIKAEAVREWADQAAPNNESEDKMVNDAYDYADKIERGGL